MNHQLKQFNLGSIILIFLFSITPGFGQSLDLVATTVGGDHGYTVQISGLPKLETLDPKGVIQPYYTTMLFLSSGHYLIDSIPAGDVMSVVKLPDHLTLGKEMGDKTSLNAYMLYSERYNNPPPPRSSSMSTSVNPAKINAKPNFGSFKNHTKKFNDVFIESNHGLLDGRTNGYAVSFRPVSDGTLYVFYNRKKTGGDAKDTETLTYDSLNQPTRPYYQHSPAINDLSPFGNHIALFNGTGKFNSVLIYAVDEMEFELGKDSIDSRLFFNLENHNLKGTENTYDMLAVLTSSPGGVQAFSDKSPGYDIIKNATRGFFDINEEKVVGFYLLNQPTLLPKDPNSLTLIESCRCSDMLDSFEIFNMTYKFKFCNKSDTGEIAPATEATITIENDWNHFQDCDTVISYDPVQAILQKRGKGIYVMDSLELKDLNLTRDTNSSCAELSFKVFTKPGINLRDFLRLRTCASFLKGQNSRACAEYSAYIGDIIENEEFKECTEKFTFCSKRRNFNRWRYWRY